MRLNYKARKFQEGGAVAPEEAPMEQEVPEQGGGDPLMQLAQMAAQALQSQDCQAAMAVCESFLQIVQQAQGGAQPQGQPVFKRGGKIVGWVK